jgi:hypothetical protein
MWRDKWLNRTTTVSYSDAGAGVRLRLPRPDRPGDHRPEERPQRHLLPGLAGSRAEHHDLLPGVVVPLSRHGRWLVGEKADAGKVPVEDPAHGGQLVGVVQRAPRVPHRPATAAGPAFLCLMVLTRHAAITIWSSRRSIALAGSWRRRRSCNAIRSKGRNGASICLSLEIEFA